MTTPAQLEELRRESADAWQEMQNLVASADAARRNMTEAEIEEWGRFEQKLVRTRQQILEADLGRSMPSPMDTSRMQQRDRRPGEIVTLRNDEHLSGEVDTSLPGQELRLDALVRAAVTGDWGKIEPDTRAMAIGTPGAGGLLVPEPLSARVIDKARAQARVLQAGATTVPMDSSTLKMGRIASDPSAGWKLENAAGNLSDMTLEAVEFKARTLMTIVKASVELTEDAPTIEDTIENAIAAALALELDRAALRGSGTGPEPLGLRNQSGVTIQSMGVNGAALASYGPLSLAVEAIRASNGEPNAVIYAPRTSGRFDRLADTTGQPLRPPPSVEGLAKLTTAQLPTDLVQGTSTDTSEAYVGQWNEMLIGVRRTIKIEVSRQAADPVAGDSAFRNLQVWIRAYLRADVQLAQPSHFVVITGLRP